MTDEAPDDLAQWLEVQADGTSVLRLEEPVVIGQLRVEKLYIRKIRAKHMRAMRSQDTAGMLELLEAVTHETRAVIDELGVRDTTRALEVVGRGFDAGPATGAG